MSHHAVGPARCGNGAPADAGHGFCRLLGGRDGILVAGALAVAIAAGCERHSGTRADLSSEGPPEVWRVPCLPQRSSQPCAAVYVTGSGKGAPERPRVIVAVWDDGFAVRSADRVRGGPPYSVCAARLADMDRALRLLQDRAEGSGAVGRQWYIGQDSWFTVIAVARSGFRIELASWHELFESHPNLVATAEGIVPLDGCDRSALLAREPSSYREFRALWAALRDAVESAVAEAGEPTEALDFEFREAAE